MYVDIVLGPDSVAWVERYVTVGPRLMDRFHATRGYIGTAPFIGERLPLALSDSCAFSVELVAEFYGVVRHCPAPELL